MRPARGLILLLAGLFGVPACLQDEMEDRFSKGFDLLYENRYEDAENHFLVIAREMARSAEPEATLAQARALYHVGRIDHLYLDQPHRAVGRLREALKLAPDAPFAFDARQEIGLIFQNRLMDYRTAALEFERLVSEFPDRKGIELYQYRVAQCYFLLREFDQARTEARLLLQKWPKGEFTDEARLLIANSYYFEGRLQEAATAHKELLETNPETAIRARSLFELGMCYQDLGDRIQAEKVYLEALKDHPRPDLVQMQLSQLRTRIVEEDEKAKPLDRPVPLKKRRLGAAPVQDALRAPAPAAGPGAQPKARTAPAIQKKPEPKAAIPTRESAPTPGNGAKKTAPAPAATPTVKTQEKADPGPGQPPQVAPEGPAPAAGAEKAPSPPRPTPTTGSEKTTPPVRTTPATQPRPASEPSVQE
jgi:tetratricopeptide (TPR) repeat protein